MRDIKRSRLKLSAENLQLLKNGAQLLRIPIDTSPMAAWLQDNDMDGYVIVPPFVNDIELSEDDDFRRGLHTWERDPLGWHEMFSYQPDTDRYDDHYDRWIDANSDKDHTKAFAVSFPALRPDIVSAGIEWSIKKNSMKIVEESGQFFWEFKTEKVRT